VFSGWVATSHALRPTCREEIQVIRWVVLLTLLAAALVAAYLTLAPVPIAPVAWNPSPAPALDGPYSPNSHLTQSQRLLEGIGLGPEDVAFDDAGNLYTGFQGGDIVRVPVDGGQPEVFLNTSGRPLGMTFDSRGNLIVADAFRGLLSIWPDGNIVTLATGSNDVLFGFADDVDIAPDGTIYLSDASTKFGYGADVLDIIEHGGRGRLMAYNPANGQTSVLLGGLQFANGVTVAPDGSYVLVAETGAYRIRKLWLEGPQAGSTEMFIDNLPGFPDNINFNDRGTVWVALPSQRVSSLDAVAPRPFLRKLMVRLPQFLQPAPSRYGMILEVDAAGRPLRSLHDPTGDVAFVASVMERGTELYLGSYVEPSLVVVDLPGSAVSPEIPPGKE
jgi:sugar lactone lactonase YvrE